MPIAGEAPKSINHDGPVRVLVVDDNEPSALSLSWAMELFGYEVRTCFDGKSAVAEADIFGPDVVLMDLGMPVMNGLDACKQLRSNPAHAGTLVIAQTGWSDEETRQTTRTVGFDHHMVKPVDINQLLDLLPKLTH